MAELNNTALLSDANLKAYYRLEANGDDSTENAFNLTNATIASFPAAKYGNGALGDGVDNNLYITDNLGIDGGAISVSLWAKLNNEISSGVWAFFGQTSATSKVRYEVRYEYNGGTRRLVFSRVKNNVADQSATHNVDLGTSQFHHIVLTYDGTTVKGYLNKVEVASFAASGNGATTGNSAFILFARDNGDNTINQQNYIDATLDDVGVFNREINSTEVQTLFTAEAKTLSETVTIVGTQIHALSRTLGEVITIAATFNQVVNRTLSEVVTIVDTVINQFTGKTLSETITIVDTKILFLNRVISETITIVDSVVKAVSRTLTESITIKDNLWWKHVKVALNWVKQTATSVTWNRDRGGGGS